MNLHTAVRDYLGECEFRKLSPATLSAYRYALLNLVAVITGPVRKVTPTAIRSWFNGLCHADKRKGQGSLSPATIQQCYRSAHTFFAWCVRARYASSNPLDAIPKPKIPDVTPRFLTANTSARFIAACAQGRHPERDATLALLMLDCGPRRAELASLQIDDVDLYAGTLTIRKGKGGKGRVVPVSSSTLHALRCWLAVRPDWPDDRSLFGIQKGGIYLMVCRAAKRAGLNITPHGLRHTFATHYNGPLDDLQKILGHADITTTAHTYRHRDAAELVRHHEERTPLAAIRQAAQMALPGL